MDTDRIKPPAGFVLEAPRPPAGYVLEGQGLIEIPDSAIPDELRSEADRIRNAYYYSQNLGIESDLAFDIEPEINEAIYGEGVSSNSAWNKTKQQQEKVSIWTRTNKSWARGAESLGIDFVWFDVMMGKRTEQEARALEKQFQKKLKEDPIKARNWLENIYLKTVAILPGMVGGYAEGMKYGVPAAGAVAIAGQLGPQVLAPEEIVTVPFAYYAGHIIGSMKYWSEQGAGAIYKQARDEGLPPDTAGIVAAIGGPLYGAIEHSQVDKIIPGLARFKKGLVRLGVELAKNVVLETTEEGEQRAISDGVVLLGQVAERQIKLSEVPARLKAIALNAWDEMKEAFGPMVLLQGPGASVATVNTIIESSQKKTVEMPISHTEDYLNELIEPTEPTEKPPVPPVEPRPPEIKPAIPPEAELPPTEAKPVEAVEEVIEEIPEAERVSIEAVEAAVEEPGKPMYVMERVKGLGFVIKEAATGKEKVTIRKRAEAKQRLAELNLRAKEMEPTTRKTPKVFGTEDIERLIPEPIALKSALKKAAKAARIGYKVGAAETMNKAHDAINKIRLAGKMRLQNKIDAMNIVKTYVAKEDQWRFLRRAVVATTEANVEKLTGQINEHLEKVEKRELDREFRNYTKKLRSEYKAGKRELGKLPTDVADRIKGLLKDIDLSKLTDEKREKLEKREEWYNRISGALAEGFEILNQELDTEATNSLVIRRGLIDELRRLNQTAVSDMDAMEIRTILNAIKELVYYTEKKGESKLRRRLEILSGQLNSARTEVSPKKRIRELTGLLATAEYMLVEGAANLRSLINMSTVEENSATIELLFETLVRANNLRKTVFKELIQAWSNEVKKAGLKWGDLKLNDKTTVTIGGREVEITYGDLISIYAHTQADENLNQLLKTQGLNITTYSKFSKKQYRVGTPTLAELRAVGEKLSDSQKKLVDIHFKINREIQAPLINKTSMALYNYALAYLNKYFHLSREIEVPGGLLGHVFTSEEVSSAIEEQGRFKFRTGGSARINIRPFMMEVMQGLQQDSFFHAMTESMENARSLIANKAWRQEMKKAGRGKELKTITKLIARIQVNSSDQSMIEQMSMRLIGNAGKSILGFRISGGAVQVASLPVAKTVIDSKYFSGIGIQTKAEIKALMEKIPSLWIRWKAKQYDYAAGLATSFNAFETLIFEHESITDKMLFPYTIGDQTAVYRIYKAAENQIEGTTNLKRGTKEFDEAVLHLFNRAMETQPMWENLYRSELTSSPHAWTRAFTIFMSARIAQHNVILQSIDNEQKGRIDKSMRNKNLGYVGLANFYVSAFRHIVKNVIKYGGMAAMVAMGLRPPPDEDELKENVKRLGVKLPQETVLNIVGLSPAGQVISAAAYNMIRAIKFKHTKIEPRDLRTGNLLVDIAGDMIQTGMEGALFSYYLFNPDEKWQSGPDKGDPKWIRYGTRFAYGVSLLTAYGFGIAFEGPISDIYYQLKNAYRTPKKPKPKGGFRR